MTLSIWVVVLDARRSADRSKFVIKRYYHLANSISAFLFFVCLFVCLYIFEIDLIVRFIYLFSAYAKQAIRHARIEKIDGYKTEHKIEGCLGSSGLEES